MDEYRNSFEVFEKKLNIYGLEIQEVQAAFIRRCIFPYAFQYAKLNDFSTAKRILSFGQACYPQFCNRFIFCLFHIILSTPGLNWLFFRTVARLR